MWVLVRIIIFSILFESSYAQEIIRGNVSKFIDSIMSKNTDQLIINDSINSIWKLMGKDILSSNYKNVNQNSSKIGYKFVKFIDSSDIQVKSFYLLIPQNAQSFSLGIYVFSSQMMRKNIFYQVNPNQPSANYIKFLKKTSASGLLFFDSKLKAFNLDAFNIVNEFDLSLINKRFKVLDYMKQNYLISLVFKDENEINEGINKIIAEFPDEVIQENELAKVMDNFYTNAAKGLSIFDLYLRFEPEFFLHKSAEKIDRNLKVRFNYYSFDYFLPFGLFLGIDVKILDKLSVYLRYGFQSANESFTGVESVLLLKYFLSKNTFIEGGYGLFKKFGYMGHVSMSEQSGPNSVVMIYDDVWRNSVCFGSGYKLTNSFNLDFLLSFPIKQYYAELKTRTINWNNHSPDRDPTTVWDNKYQNYLYIVFKIGLNLYL